MTTDAIMAEIDHLRDALERSGRSYTNRERCLAYLDTAEHAVCCVRIEIEAMGGLDPEDQTPARDERDFEGECPDPDDPDDGEFYSFADVGKAAIEAGEAGDEEFTLGILGFRIINPNRLRGLTKAIRRGMGDDLYETIIHECLLRNN